MSIIALFLHIQHPRGPPEATVPPTSRYGSRIENRPAKTVGVGSTAAVKFVVPGIRELLSARHCHGARKRVGRSWLLPTFAPNCDGALVRLLWAKRLAAGAEARGGKQLGSRNRLL